MPTDARRIRPVRLGAIDTTVRRGADGVIYLLSSQPLGDYPIRITDCLERWAREAPERTFLAERPSDVVSGFTRTSDDWRRITYAEALTQVRSIAQALLSRKLSVDRPILILSGNGIDHGLLALGAMYAGVPYAPIAPA